MPITENDVFIGPALSCANLADEKLGMRIPRDLAGYIHSYRKNLSLPIFTGEFQPERRWVQDCGNNFVPKGDNSWWYHYGTNKEFQYELHNNPLLIGVHTPIKGIDIFDSSYFDYKKKQSIASIIESWEYANAIGAKWVTIHASQQDYWVAPHDRFNYIEEFLRIYNYLASVYRKRNFRFTPCIEILEYPKFPATPYETEDILNMCKTILPQTRIAFDVSHLWRSRGIICDVRPPGFQNVYEISFIEELKDTLDRLGPNDAYIFHLGGCWGINTHGVPGICPDENPFEAMYRLDHPDCFYDENYEMNISRVLELIIDYCWKYNQPLILILEIFEREYSIIIKSIWEMRNAIINKIRRRWQE